VSNEWRTAFIVLAAALLTPGCAKKPADGDASEAAADHAESPPEARELLMEMATFLSKLDGFSANIRGGYDVLQESGQKIEFLESREVTLDRPNRLLIQERNADGRGSSVIFDGSKMTMWDHEAEVFARADQPGSVDDAVVYFVRDLQMRMPLAPFFTTRFPAELERRVQSIDYVELTDVLGKPAHHIAARTRKLDFQIWIAAGEQPLPLRVVLTYPDDGRPQYWAQFSDWNLRPQVSEKTFAFEPPQDARQIAFAVQISPISTGFASPPAEATKGDGS
jgi:hypothetical protein